MNLSSCLQAVIKAIQDTKTDAQDKPQRDVAIADCGILEIGKPFTVEKSDAVE